MSCVRHPSAFMLTSRIARTLIQVNIPATSTGKPLTSKTCGENIGGDPGILDTMATKDSLAKKTVADLREMARARGLSGYSGLKKTELIALLSETHAARPSAIAAKPARTKATKPKSATARTRPAVVRPADASDTARHNEPPARLIAERAHISNVEERIETAKYAEAPRGAALAGRALDDLHEDIDSLPLPVEPLLALMPQKPGILHAYWSLTANAPAPERLRLRLCRLADERLIVLEEIAPPAARGHWYFHVPEGIVPGEYWLHLGHYVNDEFVTAIRRGLARIPSLYAAQGDERQGRMDEARFRLLYLRAGGTVRFGRLAWMGGTSSQR